jgi:hypothetical protein
VLCQRSEWADLQFDGVGLLRCRYPPFPHRTRKEWGTRLTIDTATGGKLQVNANGVFTAQSFHVNLSTPASSSAPCIAGQIGADANYIYICVATNRWKRSALSSF